MIVLLITSIPITPGGVGIAALAYIGLFSQIAGDQIDVRFPSIDGDPAMWVPGGDDLAMLQIC